MPPGDPSKRTISAPSARLGAVAISALAGGLVLLAIAVIWVSQSTPREPVLHVIVD